VRASFRVMRGGFQFVGRWLPCLRVVLLCIRCSGVHQRERVGRYSKDIVGVACSERALCWGVGVGVVGRLVG
jgi:hypothetical protein